jgi:hypothetical protein
MGPWIRVFLVVFLTSSPPSLTPELDIAKSTEYKTWKTIFASKRLDARLDRWRGVYIDGFLGK